MYELIIMVGLPASGKSTYVREYLYDTHVRINMDMLKKKSRMMKLFKTCLATQTNMVIDNTNMSIANRKEFIDLAKEDKGCTIKCIFFNVGKDICLARNKDRINKVPAVAIHSAARRFDEPEIIEGFNEIKHMNDNIKLIDTTIINVPWDCAEIK